MNAETAVERICVRCGQAILGETVMWRATGGPWHARCMPPPHEHKFEYLGYAAFVGTNMGVWWWACDCGLHVWHQRGSLERGILAGHFVSAENAPKEFVEG